MSTAKQIANTIGKYFEPEERFTFVNRRKSKTRCEYLDHMGIRCRHSVSAYLYDMRGWEIAVCGGCYQTAFAILREKIARVKVLIRQNGNTFEEIREVKHTADVKSILKAAKVLKGKAG